MFLEFLTGIQSPDFADVDVLWSGWGFVEAIWVPAAVAGAVVAVAPDDAVAVAVSATFAASSTSLFLLNVFLESTSISSGKVTSFVTISSSSPKIATAALPAWSMTVLVRECWLRLILFREEGEDEVGVLFS